MPNKPPKRSDFPAGSEGMAQFQKALKIYQRTGAASILGLPSKSGKQIGTDVKVDDLKKSNIRIQRAATQGRDISMKKGGYVNPKSNKRKGESWSNRDNQFD